ncbi:MAG: hypothetical protein JW849_04150 [Phycisphaerae bacterium]|nr:hypothetical protein [Phycisphaerae bacterium]
MGAQLKKCFDFVNAQGGLPMQMRLAMKLGVTSDKAAALPDDPAMVSKAKAVVKEITGKDV